MADTGGFFGNLMSRMPGNNQSNTGAGFAGTNIPTLPQFVSGLFGGNVQSQGIARDFDATYGNFTQDGIDRNNAQIWGDPLMSSASDDNEHPSQMRPSDHTVVSMGGSAGGGGGNRYSHASGNLQSLGGMGRTVGHATMGQVEQMLSGGMRGRGERQLFPPHELNEERAEAKKLGLTLNQYRSQS